jgi:hypothetical protein
MDINDKAVEITSRLRLGAMIARDRNINLDFAKIADESADVIDILRQQLTKPADDTISVSKPEYEQLVADKKLLDSGEIILSGDDGFGGRCKIHHKGCNLREAIDAAIQGASNG